MTITEAIEFLESQIDFTHGRCQKAWRVIKVKCQNIEAKRENNEIKIQDDEAKHETNFLYQDYEVKCRSCTGDGQQCIYPSQCTGCSNDDEYKNYVKK